VFIYFNSSTISKIITDTGYVENEAINSTVETLDTLSANGIRYDGILHFTLLDFKEEWTDFTITEVYFAKHIGLIKYSFNNGVTYER
jgi:hypothetical protein